MNGRSADWKAGFNHAMNVMAFWLDFQSHVRKLADQDLASPAGLNRVGMMKSELLGRLMRGEAIRREPCPNHKGRMWCHQPDVAQQDFSCCQGTGWLPNEKK